MAKADKIADIDAASNFRVAIGRVIEQRFDEMMRFREGTILGRDPEALHDMRVASRRLRAAMDVAAGCFPKKYRTYHRSVKELTDVLGGVRDYDVMREALTDYRSSRPADERHAINRVLRQLQQERETCRAEMLTFFERLDDERFDLRFRAFLAEHTRG